MSIPSSSQYPSALDSDTNLFLVHDSLKVLLVENYTPGDTIITVSGDTTNFPPSGFLTITSQCEQDTSTRAIAFYYGIVTATTFEELEILPGFTDVPKQAFATDVTLNVMAEHHDSIKQAIVAIEEFAGVKGTVDKTPLGDTMEGRTNFLQNLVLRPRAWFTANQLVGIAPLTITFTDQSFRNPTYWKWCFGDVGSSSIISIPTISGPSVPSDVSCVIDGQQVIKTYYQPGYYSVSLTISNTFGSDSVVFENMINVRAAAPDEATLQFIDINSSNQVLTEDFSLPTGGVIKSKINTLIHIQVVGNGQRPDDPIIEYVWKLGDLLDHFNSPQTDAMYDLGGLYDLKLTVDTEFGAYRTTVVENAIDIIEATNLWYSVFPQQTYQSSKQVTTYEFGLLSNSFKTTSRNYSPLIQRDYSFLTGTPQEAQQKKEFLRNNGFHAKNTTDSGDRGTTFFYWASGYNSNTQSWTDQKIDFLEYEGFSDCYTTSPLTSNCNALSTSVLSRAWNWTSFNTSTSVFFFLGNTNTTPVASSPTNQTLSQFNLQTLTSNDTTLTASNYTNGANELLNNVDFGSSGNFSAYRSAWLNSTGFMLRNDANNIYFRISSFYQTSGVLSNLIQSIQKLNDMPGTAKTECQICSLISGVYVFNNSGEVLAYNPSSQTWNIGGPGVNSPSWTALQDPTVATYQDPTIPNSPTISFDDQSQRLIATSDSNRSAYLSFDYSPNTFVNFNEITKSFTSLGSSRPNGEQFMMGIY